MPEQELFEQVVDQQGVTRQGLSGGLRTIIDKLTELEIKIDEINKKIPEAQSS